MRGLAGASFLVAGGGGGIGAATALRLAEEGARVAVGDLNLQGAQDVAAQIRESGGTAVAVGYDQSDESSIVSLVAQAADAFGGLDGLHANAADLSPGTIGKDRDVLRMDVAVWERTLSVDLIGYAVLVREVLPHLLGRSAGSIVCTSSAGSELGQSAQVAYAASKAGINALVRHVAKTWGPKGIRCNAVSPGIVLSEAAMEIQSEAALADYRSSTPSARLGRPDDIAGTVAFLLSTEGEWVNGQVWSVNGGMTTRG